MGGLHLNKREKKHTHAAKPFVRNYNDVPEPFNELFMRRSCLEMDPNVAFRTVKIAGNLLAINIWSCFASILG